MCSDALGEGDLERRAKRDEIGQRWFKDVRRVTCGQIAASRLPASIDCGVGGVRLSAGPFARAGFQSRVQPGCERNVL